MSCHSSLVQPPLLQGFDEPSPLELLPASQLVPAHLLRTLRASMAAATPHSSAGLLLLAAHAAMLESGFVPIWACRASEGVGSSGEGNVGAASAWAVPANAWVSTGLARIDYRLAPSGNGSDSNDAGSGVMDAEPAAQALATGADGARAPAAGPGCTLQCSSLGGGRCVLAVATRAHTRHLALQAVDYVQPWVGCEAAAADAAGPSSSGVVGPPAGPRPVQLLPGGGLAVGGALALQPPAVRDLWRRLKDGLAFPMLLAAYAEAGLQPPAGLLALPEELKQRVLGLLGVSARLRAARLQERAKGRALQTDAPWQRHGRSCARAAAVQRPQLCQGLGTPPRQPPCARRIAGARPSPAALRSLRSLHAQHPPASPPAGPGPGLPGGHLLRAAPPVLSRRAVAPAAGTRVPARDPLLRGSGAAAVWAGRGALLPGMGLAVRWEAGQGWGWVLGQQVGMESHARQWGFPPAASRSTRAQQPG